MFRRFISLLALCWLLGFAWFAMFLPQPAGDERTDAAVVFTGGEGRIPRGLEVLDRKQAPHLFISGVDREVKPGEFRAEYDISSARMKCCVTLGYASVDTRGNAAETAAWLRQRKARSARLITSDWHMRRAALELEGAVPDDFRIVRDAVPTQPKLETLFKEYHKFLARGLARLWEG
ncbi:MAG: YdcF family protein [Novosphingobium sp.]|nr:YdcF family protein [Novosphingobium sp.]